MQLDINKGTEEQFVQDLFLNQNPPFVVSFTHLPYSELAVGDCTREVRVTLNNDYYIFQGMHCSNGQWKLTSKENAVQWLVEALLQNVKILGSHESCLYRINRES
ncbi:hypothetical protein ACPV30_14655 [Photobacterium damselae]|uniref:hypothetical protein n=1 Tax=Photobacterium damselae TaxID=38293 RepID=UPI004067AC02